MRIIIAALLPLLLPSCPGTPSSAKRAANAARAPSLAHVPDSGKVYRGPDGMAVALARVVDGPFVIRISGSSSLIDGMALPYRFDTSNPRRWVYVTTIGGRDRWMVHVERPHGEASRYRLFLPGVGRSEGIALSYDEQRSRALDTPGLVAGYERILANGTIAKLQRFDRQAAQAAQMKQIARHVAALNAACETSVTAAIDWPSIDDERLKRLSVAGYCRPPIRALAQLCRWSSAKRIIAAELRELRCAFGKQRALARSGSRLSWTVTEEAKNSDRYAREQIAGQITWKGGVRLSSMMYGEDTEVCYDGKATYVGWHPRVAAESYTGAGGKQVFFGESRRFRRVAPVALAGDGWFFDPRYFAPNNNPNFRGIDFRVHSRLSLDRAKGRCAVVCGSRTIALEHLPRDKVARLVAGATFEPPVAHRVPYGLARDRRGIYYLVDRASEAASRDFRLFVGPTGKLKRVKMINIVSDSEGDVFSTRSGKLRLVLEREHSFWIRGRKRRMLINVPIPQNLGLIYNELGVYLGEPFGTPCDRL